MTHPRRIFVFPCGSEVGLEIHRSLQHSAHFELIGGASTDDHGRFVFENYIGDLPFHDAPGFADALIRVVNEQRIDAIYPAMDAVADTVQSLAPRLPCQVIGSSARATAICASKSATYALLEGRVALPTQYAAPETAQYPIFIKPDRGYGTRNCLKADNPEAAQQFLAQSAPRTFLLQEYLPGREWTVDCFSDRHGTLRFHAARGRDRISNGISVRTSPRNDFAETFAAWAAHINEALHPRGGWFFQAREDDRGQPRLLEVAARIGGSSSLFRCQGVNFALLSAFDAFEQDVFIAPNTYALELDRALDNRYRLSIAYGHIFVDLDDCLIVRGSINHQLVSFLYKSIGEGKSITLLTRHARDPRQTLLMWRIGDLFDHVVHLMPHEKKSTYIDRKDAIFIDDSFAERQDVAQRTGIPVFAPDMVEALL